MIIIGISGKKLSGKTTLARMIINRCKYLAVEVGFADALKAEVCAACSVSKEHLEEHKAQFRTILQWWGTDFRRAGDQDYWVKKLGNGLLHNIFKPDVVLIPDVRFPNEVAFVKELSGPLIRVERLDTGYDTHASECSLDDYKFDWIVRNYGTLNDLQNHADRICKHFGIATKTTT